MSSMTIHLDDDWVIDDNTIEIIRTGGSVARYKLPRGKARVVVSPIDDEKSRLILGGFTTVTVSVVGPHQPIQQLREAVL